MAKPTRQPANTQARKDKIKVTVSLDATQYVRLAAGAAMRQVTHSRFVAEAIEAALREMGLFVGQRRSAGQGDAPITVDSIDESAA